MGREPLPAKCVPCILSPKVNICAVVEQMLDYSPGAPQPELTPQRLPRVTPPSKNPQHPPPAEADMDWNVPEQPTTPQPDPESRAASPGSAPRPPLSRRRFLGRAG